MKQEFLNGIFVYEERNGEHILAGREVPAAVSLPSPLTGERRGAAGRWELAAWVSLGAAGRVMGNKKGPITSDRASYLPAGHLFVAYR
jgi:hypothetical protein